MNSLKVKSGIGMALLVLFAITLVTGIVLHLKKHGIVVEPRNVIKIIHWLGGFAMTFLVCLHGKHFWSVLVNSLKKHTLSKVNTFALIILVTATTITGLVKLVSPVKIQGLGLWHYWLGIIMSASVMIHLFRGVPMLVNMIKASRKARS